MTEVDTRQERSCPFCGEQVLLVAIKCKHCGSLIAEPPSPKAPRPPAVSAPVADIPKPPGSGNVWRMLLGAVLILGVAPLPASKGPVIERGSDYWHGIAAKMSDQDSVMVTATSAKVMGPGEAARKRQLIDKLWSMSFNDRVTYCLVGSGCDLPGSLSDDPPAIASRQEVLKIMSAIADKEQARDVGTALAFALCVVAATLSLLTLRKRPWLRGDVSQARRARSASAFRLALIALVMCCIGIAWSVFMLVKNSLMPTIVVPGMAAAALTFGLVALKFFGDAKALRATVPGNGP